MKVIGAGFGRTGTSSLREALNYLGYRCYHMSEVEKNPGHDALWLQATQAKGQQRSVDWGSLFRGYDAAVDFPPAAFYRQILDAFPDAKVILSERDFESWYQSCLDTIYKITCIRNSLYFRFVRFLFPGGNMHHRMVDAVIWSGVFHGRFLDKEYVRSIYHQHIEEVKRLVPKDQLLLFNVKEGWGPLCRFLGKPVPEGMLFPRVNDTEDFNRIIHAAQRRATLFISLPSAMLLLSAGLVLAYTNRFKLLSNI
eukprot:TRINITY_DN13683_c0_g1_i3.p1 TRINITY_DN13683_c0_g1~~TRINITY_DN13683_c0_g1_i3.p1  ORF type:complete len:253 (+),score=32.25 TRINITY_DN13683_c0_g1_i3:208-966(+)